MACTYLTGFFLKILAMVGRAPRIRQGAEGTLKCSSVTPSSFKGTEEVNRKVECSRRRGAMSQYRGTGGASEGGFGWVCGSRERETAVLSGADSQLHYL